MVSIHDSRLYVHSLQNIFIPQKGCIRRLLCQPGTLGSVSLHYQKSTSPSMVVVICKSACCTSTSIEELNGKCKSGAWREALSIREPPDVYIFFFFFSDFASLLPREFHYILLCAWSPESRCHHAFVWLASSHLVSSQFGLHQIRLKGTPHLHKLKRFF
jgi:hypothetical protein